MAVYNIPVTYPDGDAPRILAALKWNYGQVSDGAGGMRDMTNAEALAKLSASVRHSVVDMVLRYERETAAKAAADAVVPVAVS